MTSSGFFRFDYIYKQGWLWKRGHFRKNWKKRYMVLRGNVISYFPNQTTDNSKARGLIDCEGATISDYPKRTNGFLVRESTGKEFPMSAKSEEEKNEWIEVLSHVSQNKAPPPKQTTKSNSNQN
eukprot:Anaeramoba_ignava/a246591_67.p1 GENE.a246591_67~~a246591_67.p1  ORF type:complete len:124 (-),score=36.93 a246591_67:12-383(-)